MRSSEPYKMIQEYFWSELTSVITLESTVLQTIHIAYCWSIHPLHQNIISDDKILPVSVYLDHETYMRKVQSITTEDFSPVYNAVNPGPIPCFAIGRLCSETVRNTSAVALNLLLS